MAAGRDQSKCAMGNARRLEVVPSAGGEATVTLTVAVQVELRAAQTL